MCGIAGFYSSSNNIEQNKILLQKASAAIHKRGPDNEGFYFDKNVGLAHRRLSIIDTSEGAHQPFHSDDKNFTIIFNGEIFNYKELQLQHLPNEKFYTTSDTEVLLKLFIKLGNSCFELLNGFFAVAIYNQYDESITIARDRYGKKPLLTFQNENGFYFASEMKALFQFGIKKEIDKASLVQYFQFNYLPPHASLIKGVEKMEPGIIKIINAKGVTSQKFYELKITSENNKLNYEDAQSKLLHLLDEATQRRMVSDVPLGAFLSGGIDSSVIVALASQYKKGLHTFSIGYKDEPFFDETKYAELVAKKYQTNHTVFKLTNDDFLQHLYDVLDYIDEPFADSSALAVYILSNHTRKQATVALSGDGADEIFAGYNKYAAEFQMRKKSIKNDVVKNLAPVWDALPKSRNHKLTNLFRQLNRFADGAKLSTAERHWRWCSWMQFENVQQLLNINDAEILNEVNQRKLFFLQNFTAKNDFNEVLLTDTNLVLKGDMLVKVDMMSMANSLEIRSPFLDYTVVDFAFSLPAEFKINSTLKKRIVQDAFRHLLPTELYNRPKHGFEVPLLKWFRNELKSLIEDDLLNDKFILEQKIFNLQYIQQLKQQLNSNNPGDAAANIWALIVFQWWWKKYFI
jgi:asparagine synthase (glutamine-hydrolysing)